MRLLAEVFGSALARKRAQEELDNAIGFERLASSILASLVPAKPGAEGNAIWIGLREIGKFVGADQVALWLCFGAEARAGAVQNWQAEGAAAPIGSGDAADFPWIESRIAGGHVVRFARIDELPTEARVDSAALRARGICSLLLVPISVSGQISGALSIASLQREHEWPDVLTPGVRLLAEVFGSLQAREAAERAAEVKAAHWRERLAHLVRIHTAGEVSLAFAHEITQPLGAIENYAMAARRRACEAAPQPAHVLELLDKVIGQATRGGDVVRRMRGLAQRHELELKATDIERTVVECVDMVKVDCDLRHIRIRLEATNSIPFVPVDEIHLQQVILNLLRNAVEAIEVSKTVSSREIVIAMLLNENDEIVVEVSDSGAGIHEGDLERVFDLFYSTKSSGLGVGLAICRKLIEAHGGSLWASHNQDGGAIFSFTLPVASK